MARALDQEIKNLHTLKELLDDPYYAEIAASYLSERSSTLRAVRVNGEADATPPTHSRSPLHRKRKKKRGALTRKVFEVVKTSTSALSAKDVAEAMEQSGYAFATDDKYVSVSKALRSLAKRQKISDKRGANPKAAILYSRLPSLVPVQERTQ